MATSSTIPSSSNPSWFTPKRLLMIFCMINMLNYVDRGAIASNGVNGSLGTCSETGICTSGSGIQGDFNLNNFQDGVLSSAFMVGLLVASPIFAALAKSHNPFRLIGVGLSVWTFATAGCGISFDFFSITFCRMLVGVGEASFISLAAPFIDDNAPAAQKTAWLAMFYMCIPTGVALGYVYGGVVSSNLLYFGCLSLKLVVHFVSFCESPSYVDRRTTTLYAGLFVWVFFKFVLVAMNLHQYFGSFSATHQYLVRVCSFFGWMQFQNYDISQIE